MPPAERIQKLIHSLDTGALPRYLRIVTLGLAVLALAVLHDFRAYRNLDTPEAMDAAQLARNISEGKGYTTLFIRPLSVYLVQKRNQAKSGGQRGRRRGFRAAQNHAPGPGEPAGVSGRAGGVDESAAVSLRGRISRNLLERRRKFFDLRAGFFDRAVQSNAADGCGRADIFDRAKIV